ncbi:hypothetical protein NL676_030855 [Syzygium grande]|nr:hypothetical protein NL676_030855 [Syzygium grande]
MRRTAERNAEGGAGVGSFDRGGASNANGEAAVGAAKALSEGEALHVSVSMRQEHNQSIDRDVIRRSSSFGS